MVKNLKKIKIGVVGAGSWGTALANHLALKGFKIDQWVFESDVFFDIKNFNENKKFLPGVKLSENLYPHKKLEKVVISKDLVIVVVPSHVFRSIVMKFSSFLSSKTILVSASKGIENFTYLTMSNVLNSVITGLRNKKIAVITGPSFAEEVSRKVPTLVTLATSDKELGLFLQKLFATDYFRVYTVDDIIGAELGGAIKNVIAIAAGIIDGLGLGLNTRAALITRGLTEIRRLGISMGANSRTFSGLSGLGDLILTCTGNLSRNYLAGVEVGRGKILNDFFEKTGMVIEGVRTTESVYKLSKSLNVEMPIVDSVYNVLYNGISPREELYKLMSRDLRKELDDI